MTREEQAHALGVVTGRREMTERLAAELRRRVVVWRASQQGKGLIASARAALLWSVTEAWCGRLEGLAGELERQAQAFATDEQRRRAVFEQTPAKPKRRWPWA